MQTRYATLFRQRVPASKSPPGSPTGPLRREIQRTGHFYLLLNISLFIFPSESLVWEFPPCSLTWSPWAAILRHQCHWSTFHSSIHSFMYVCQGPQKGALLHAYGEKHKVIFHGAPRRRNPTYNGVRPSSPRGPASRWSELHLHSQF